MLSGPHAVNAWKFSSVQFTHTISTTELPFLGVKLRIRDDQISPSIYYKDTDTQTYRHHHSLHPRHCKESLRRSQLLRTRHLCSYDSDSLKRGKEMRSIFFQRGYCANSLQHDLDQIRRIDRITAINRPNSANRDQSRIPLVLTYHPRNGRIKRILLSNFANLSGDPATREIFPQPSMVAYRRDRNLQDILIQTSDKSQPGPMVGTSPCAHTRCRTCGQISTDTTLQGPKCSIVVKEAFTCQTSDLAYCISCGRCPPGLSMSEKLAVHSGNALVSTYAGLRKTCPVFQSWSISMLTAILYTTQKSVALCSA